MTLDVLREKAGEDAELDDRAARITSPDALWDLLAAMCREFLRLADATEVQAQCNRVTGAITGGLMGFGSTATDPVLVAVHERSSALQERIFDPLKGRQEVANL